MTYENSKIYVENLEEEIRRKDNIDQLLHRCLEKLISRISYF